MSNRLTFSLASLILIMAFVAIPVMAHDNIEGDTNFATHATTGHMHPEITVTIEDADPTMDGIQVVDTEEDEPDFTAAVDPKIEFEVTLTVPVGAQDGGSDVAATTFAVADVPIVAYKSDFTAVGASIAFETTPGWTAGTGANTRQWTATAILTLANVPSATTGADDAANAALTEAAHDKAIADAIAAGIMVDITVNANLIQTTNLVGGTMVGQANLESKTTVTVIASEVTPAVAVTGTAARTKVNGRTNAVVTISATAPAMVPSGLMASDFSVMDGTTALTLTPNAWDDTANTLTITPAATAIEDSVITVSTSDDGAKKITLSDVTINVDRTAPMVNFTPPTGDVVAGNAAMVTVAVSGADTDEAVELADISVSQNADGSVSTLAHAYNPTTGTITFTPTAASTVTVTVKKDAVMDDVMNGSPKAEITITVTSPTAVMAAPSAAKVSGSADVIVTISATAPAMVPTGLMASDFSVMEAPVDTSSDATMTPTVAINDDGDELTITPDATAAEDSTITVSASTAGMLKIDFTDVMVSVDRTVPMVTITPPTGDVKANQPAMATVAFTGADTGEAIATDEITVTQTVTVMDSDPTMTVLGHAYDATTGVVTFTPTAESTVKVSVDAFAVTDDVDNSNDPTSITITVGPADLVDSTGPMATITGMQGTARAFDVTITFSEALGADETLTADEITVTGGTIASVAVDATDAKIYTGMITPNHGVTAVTVQVNAGAVKDASPAMNANVATPATAHSITVRSTTAPMSAMIPSKGYAVFVPMDHDSDALPGGLTPTTVADMPNLVSFFKTGGTIDVVVTGKANHNVIITEIMVAEDLGRVGQTGTMRPEAGQWIELYNNTDAAISVDDITITFTTGYPATGAPTDATDRLSNTVAPGWGFEAAFAGALSGQTAVNASGITTVISTNMFKSLRRVHKDDKQLQAAGTVIQNGWAQGSWKLTTDSRVFLAGRVGTPGSENRPTVFTPAVFTAPTMSVTFNEVANRNDNDNEWIELKGPKDTNLKLHKISIVTGYDKAANTGTETEIYKFPDADVKIPAGDLLLLTDQDPVNNELAADLEKGVPKPVRYRVVTLKPLPNSGDFLLVLRNKDGKILDVAGHLAGLSDDDPYTLMWPLAANVGAAKPGRISAKNKLAGGNVYKRARAIQGYLANKDNGDEPAFEGAGFSGVGYDRQISAANKEHHGTPGYPNNAQIGAGTEATSKVIISEIMFADGTDSFPQWIEIHNQSDTNGVDLHNWRLYIINHGENADGSTFAGKIIDEVWLRNIKIPPNQTALIVTRSAPRHTTNLTAPQRLLNLRYDKPLLSSKGFSLKLEANSHEGDKAKRQAGDEVGNLAAEDPDNRRADHQAFMDTRWTLPAGTDGNVRISIARLTSPKRKATGTDEAGWISSADDSRGYGVATYYGRQSDIGSPGHTTGGVLPVSLSKFRPERLDSGEIVVRWITESELNNAGFNILRSEKRDSEYTKLNTKLIAGKGTTSERHTYEWKDTSAKPNVVYYYQIQDVSIDGQVQTLRLSRLKGHVSPAGKATTTWGELKALQ
ncbi:MAG: hypothetical protein OXU51_22340 [Candidatus Poribacteria bacterium]|nr:hypothetical protein [Candidatus Poribacteria bacterium]